ncbi:hypothetical protein [Massilia aquatica]|uniref:Tyr recombinase domain-containing protein n=1 Tax=Massilia aquatica TaxID=2609000 RepID=A0ABX0M8Y0_9BURK|nr:hypothetical protein [Massilia aquatica]NHZ43646.1 hypothetical protein [Massilia aquatica]
MMTIASHNFDSVSPSPVAQPAWGEPTTWRWPVAPAVLSIYDKYSKVESVFRADAASWVIVAAGGRYFIDFAPGSVGQLQRQLALSLKKNGSAKELRTFANTLVLHWPLDMRLLSADETTLRTTWRDSVVGGRNVVSSMKTLLRYACTAEVGPWRAKHLPVINSLTTGYSEPAKKKFAEIDSRTRIISAQQQAQLVRVLDAAAKADDLSVDEVEGATALALTFQHGVRLVQVVCLDLHHVQFFNDASGDLTCVVSFHAAKQKDGYEFELLRQVKPEWVSILARQHAIAASKGRTRLCVSVGAQRIWLLVARLAKRFGVAPLCHAKNLRHTGAQMLA